MLLATKYNNLTEKLRIEQILSFSSSIFTLILRYTIFSFFFQSGLLKLQQGWEKTLDDFENIYQFPVPSSMLPFFAFFGTTTELIFPILVIIGFFSRLVVIPLFIMVCVIEFVLPYNEALEISFKSLEHYTIMISCIAIMIWGGKTLSVDYFLGKKLGFKPIKIS